MDAAISDHFAFGFRAILKHRITAHFVPKGIVGTNPVGLARIFKLQIFYFFCAPSFGV